MVNQHLSIKDIDKLLRIALRNNVDKNQLVLYSIIEKNDTSKTPDSTKGAYGNPKLIFDYTLKVYNNPRIDTVYSQVDTLKKALLSGMSIEDARHLFEVALFCVENGIAESILSHIPKKGGDDD